MRPWQLVLLRRVYSQAQGCVFTALQLGGDVEQPWLTNKYDVIHKTGSTQRITTPPEENRATAVRNTHKQFGEDRTCSYEDIIAENCFRTWNVRRAARHVGRSQCRQLANLLAYADDIERLTDELLRPAACVAAAHVLYRRQLSLPHRTDSADYRERKCAENYNR